MKHVRTSILAAFAIVAIGGSVTHAQLSNTQRETLNVPIGSIFEIQAALHTDDQANWVLTQNGEFVEASREQVFRTRFSREGTYSLAVEVRQGERTTQRMFTLEVRAKRPEDRTVADGPDGIVGFDPSLQNGTVAISRSKQVLTITPVRADVQILAIDLDTTTDANGDGNKENDEDTKNTLFRSEGNPLRIWFVDGAPRTIRFGALLDSGDTSFENINIGGVTGSQPPSQPTVQEPEQESTTMESNLDMKVLVLKSDNGEVQYALRRPADQSEPLLLLWDFGDGTQSMLDRPIHNYAESGRYDIAVEVRNLRTGETMGVVRDSIMVNRLQEDTDPTPETPVDDDEGDKTDEKEGGSLLGMVVKLVFSLIGFAALGALIMFIVGKVKRRGFSLEKTMEKAEQTMVKNPSGDVSQEPPPMEISAEEVPEETSEPAAEPEPEPPTPEPEPPTPEPTPAPQPEQPQAAEDPAPNVTHEPMAPSTSELKTDANKAPDWLQQGMQQAEAVGQTPDAPPPPNLQDTPPAAAPAETPPTPPTEPTPEPQPQPEQTPAPTSEPEPQPQPTPPAPATPQTTDAEKEAAAKEKKRRKRQRYRENLKKRKADEHTPADEPVAFITAEDIQPADTADRSDASPTPPAKNPPKPENNDHSSEENPPKAG